MCGILGLVTKEGEKDLFRLNIDSLKNRGPDGIGHYIKERVGFYHTRLAVIDKKTTSRQPIISKCGNLVLICNGEIYNYKDLMKQYVYDYQTTSDCEVILASYLQEGIDGFRNLKGMFSFGLYDDRSKKVIIYRDAVGKKPLFYYQDRNIFIFSSSVKSIIDNTHGQFSINNKALMGYLTEGYIRPDICFYNNISPVLPGTLIEFNIVSDKMSNYRIVPSSNSYQDFHYTDASIMEESNRLLDLSIRRRIAEIQDPVLLFSGGIDSTVLAKKILCFTERNLHCIGLRPLVPLTYDDPFARYAANKLKVNYISIALEYAHLKDNIEFATSLLDQPLSLYSYYFFTYLTRKAREFGNVLFVGEGGDEVFYGYSDIHSWFTNNDEAAPDIDCQVGPVIKPKLSVWGRKQVSINLLGHSFVKVDKATAEQQMEARCPYLDWDLMNFIRSIPSNYFIESGTTKIILKKMLNDFPEWFKLRKKIGSAFNFRYLMLPLYKHIYYSIDFKKLIELGIDVKISCFSYRNIFKNFDAFWKLYVLSKFI